MDLYLPWILAAIAIICIAIVLAFANAASKRYGAENGSLRERISKDESLIADLREKAARLPDVTDRAIRAESESAARLERLNELSTSNATLLANEQASQKILAALEAELAAERATTSELRTAWEQAKNRLSDREAEIRATTTLLEELRSENVRLKAVNAALNVDLANALQKSVQAEAERDAARALQERTQQFLSEAQSALKTSFTEAASKVFDEKSLSLEKKIADSSEAQGQACRTLCNLSQRASSNLRNALKSSRWKIRRLAQNLQARLTRWLH